MSDHGDFGDAGRPVCVLGLGLIGGSVLRAAHAAGREVWGATASEADAAGARADGYNVLELPHALSAAREAEALIVLAVPLTAVREILTTVRDIAPACPVTDTVGVKEPVTAAVAELLGSGHEGRGQYAGGHPMAGTTESGWAAGTANMFRGAAWVVTAEDITEPAAWARAAQLALDCGAEVVPSSAAEHDAAVARVSHLPHVLAAVLASVASDGGPLARTLAAGSLRDGTRVAGSPPDLVQAMCEGNQAPVLDAVDDTLGRLGAARGSLASTGSLKSTVEAGHAARAELTAVVSPPVHAPVRLDDAGALERLRRLGSLGGTVRGLTGNHAECALPAGATVEDLEPEDPELDVDDP